MVESTCGYLIKDGRWLMLYRNRKKNDVNAGKWIGVGGKREGSETMQECMCREITEETGLIVKDPVYRGIVWFRYEDKEEEVIYIYTAENFEGRLKDCNEGTLAWIEQDRIPDLSLWEGDRIFLKRLLNGDPTEFELELYYDRNGNLIKAKEKEA